jgi:transposase
MPTIRLTDSERGWLAHVARHAASAREARRAQALLDLDAGASVTVAARRYRVSRTAVYDWAARLADGYRAGRCLKDRPRSGRPAQARGMAERLLAEALPTDPRRHGYRHPAWTTPLLTEHLRRQGVAVSDTTVRRALRRLGYRWKRPRFVLSRRAPHWRQAKGG